MWLLGFEVSTWILLLLVVLLVTYIFSSWDPNIWKSQGVAGPYIYPIFGTFLPIMTKGLREDTIDNYLKYGKLSGGKEGNDLTLWVADEEMLRDILVKDFNNFANRRAIRLESDPIGSSMLTSLVDNDWRRVRNMLTPSFSTGKLKMMVPSIQECADLLVAAVGKTSDKGQDWDVRQVFGAYTMDVIARTGFGIEIDSQTEQAESEFVRMGKKAFEFSVLSPVVILFFFFPRLTPLLKHFDMSIFDKNVLKFFLGHLRQVIEARKNGQVSQKDFLGLMLNAHNEDVDKDAIHAEATELGGEYDHNDPNVKKGLTEYEILAQAFLFFIAGYETTAHTLTMLSHLLAYNPECQEKLHDEICNKYKDENVDYHALSQLDYLNMCVDETLRIYPPLPRLERVVAKDMTFHGIHLPKDTLTVIPTVGLHFDPEIYPEPHKFRPERFTAEAKAARSPFHYMPFGYGPRNCIGMRLAQMEIQMAAIHLIRKYKFSPCPRTENPVKFRKMGVIVPENSIWLKAERR